MSERVNLSLRKVSECGIILGKEMEEYDNAPKNNGNTEEVES